MFLDDPHADKMNVSVYIKKDPNKGDSGQRNNEKSHFSVTFHP